MVRLNWTDQAAEDLKNIHDFIASDSKRYAKITIVKLRIRAKVLKQFPLSGRIVPEIEMETIRELIEGNYRIIYNVYSKEQIDILTVHHSAKLLRKSVFTKRKK